jgi:hypothetical protein
MPHPQAPRPQVCPHLYGKRGVIRQSSQHPKYSTFWVSMLAGAPPAGMPPASGIYAQKYPCRRQTPSAGMYVQLVRPIHPLPHSALSLSCRKIPLVRGPASKRLAAGSRTRCSLESLDIPRPQPGERSPPRGGRAPSGYSRRLSRWAIPGRRRRRRATRKRRRRGAGGRQGAGGRRGRVQQAQAPGCSPLGPLPPLPELAGRRGRRGAGGGPGAAAGEAQGLGREKTTTGRGPANAQAGKQSS